MKYQVVELSIREYSGTYIDKTSWIHVRYAIGIKKGNEVYDFKTLEKYDFIERNDQGILNVHTSELVEGKTYAISSVPITFSPDKEYNDKKIEKGINESNLYSDEYKKMKRKIKK